MSNLAVRQEDLDGYMAYAAKYNEPSKPDFQKLQLLNKEGRDGFGEWWLGRKYEGRNVSVPGEKIGHIIVIEHFGQYSYYDKATESNLCHSQYFRTYPNGVRGNKFQYECGPKCPHKEARRCKMQRVVFAIALTANGDKIPCIYYAKGSGFMPFVEYIKKASQMVINGKLVDLPTFAYVTSLGAREEVNGDTVYFSPIFKFAQLIPADKLGDFAVMADQVRTYAESHQEESANSDREDVQKQPVTQTASAEPPVTTRPQMEVMDDVPWGASEPVVVSTSEPDNLAATINAALGL